jgi:mono/diheme cytochrome c family protein
MKKALLPSILLCVLFAQCVSEKPAYYIPENYAESRRKQLEDACSKGQVLYKEYCGDCHGITTKGRTNVPNFTNKQLDNYQLKFLQRDPTNHAVARQMNAEQVRQVFTFITFSKPKDAKK